MVIKRKITILKPTDYGKKESGYYHLYFILTDPFFNGETGVDQCVLSVSCSSIREGKSFDSTCVIKQGEHEFIKRDSFIHYNHLRIDKAEEIQKGIDSGSFIAKDLINDELYKRILKGILKSDNVDRRYVRFLKSAIAQCACADIFNQSVVK
jgi:hypothetical protein